MKSIYIIIDGRVQGVGFRYFALLKATELNLSGWVKNTPDGKVEIEATGEPNNLSVFIDWMKTGPTRAIIKTFSVSDITPTRTLTNFSIR
ncbi:MAG: acylphosphatase [Prolixibacteraceae bacterium]|nr:acylphosphatase [Prolixibacteraceae bacterium]MDP2889506.1 acylphosphatase [Bacteroidota bacterium]